MSTFRRKKNEGARVAPEEAAGDSKASDLSTRHGISKDISISGKKSFSRLYSFKIFFINNSK